VILSKSGEVLATATGTAERVSFQDHEVPLMKDAVVLHSHPNVIGSFSDTDIATGAANQAAELRLVDGVYNYTLKPPSGGWSESIWKHRIEPAVLDIEAKFGGHMTEAMLQGKITEAQLLANWQHEIWRRVAKQTGIVYRRRKRSS